MNEKPATIDPVMIGDHIQHWLWFVASPIGPADQHTRLVLLVVGMYLHLKIINKGVTPPSQKSIATRTGLTLGLVRKHIALAERDGWLNIGVCQIRRAGKAWCGYQYTVAIPNRLLTSGCAHCEALLKPTSPSGAVQRQSQPTLTAPASVTRH